MPEAAIVVERRANPRQKVKITVQYCEIEDFTGLQTILQKRREGVNSTQTLNLSLEGMFIVTPEPLAVGCILHLDLFLPEINYPLSASAEAVWSNETGAGLHFLEMREEYMELLKDFLDKAPTSK